MSNVVRDLWSRLGGSAPGRWLFSTAICLKAPYFLSIRPTFQSMEPGRVEITMPKRWGVTNHIGTVHAIAMCNAAELAGGTCVEVSLPGHLRWIPVGMEVQYLKMAKTSLRAVATLDTAELTSTGDKVVSVDVFDAADVVVFHADISMRVSDKTSRKKAA
jgi:acyl-coenzyme A thioesterase PaaI-like protein